MTSPPTTATARVAGAVAAAVALGVGELVTSFAGDGQSLVGSVGAGFVERFAGVLKETAVALFGTNDKAALVIGIVVISLLVGAWAGRLAARRFALGAAVFAGFGVLGVLATAADPQASLAWGIAGATLGAAAGIATLWLLLGVARTGSALPVATTATAGAAATAVEYPTRPTPDRRSFFVWSTAAGAFAVAAGAGSRALGGPSKAEQARASLTLPKPTGGVTTGTGAIDPAATAAASLDVPGLTPWIVPNGDFYRIDTAIVTPQVDPATWRLKVTGAVANPFELTFDELLALPMVEEVVTLSCVSNEVGGDLVGNARWQGVPLRTLLERAGVQPGGKQIMTRSVDGFTAGFPTEKALDGRVALVAVGMNGEPLPIQHGFPVRLVVAGLYGYVSATKWLSELTLTGWDADGYWIPRGWAKEAPIKTQSRIDVPGRRAIAAGTTPIAGVAWSPNAGIAKVEVQVDDGPWLEARLGDATNGNAWVQWVAQWDATPGEHRLRCRATDRNGVTQTEQRSRPDPDGATGWHERRVTVSG